MARREPFTNEQRRLLKIAVSMPHGQRGQSGPGAGPGQGEGKKDAGLQADGVLATDGYLVAPGRGLCANRHERYRPPRQTYPSGRTILRAIEPSAEYHSLLPLYWKLPVRKNRVESGILFTFNDGSTVSRQHSGRTSDLKETHPANLRFDKDWLTYVRAEFFAHNVGATSVRERLGFFTFEGWQF